MMKNTRKNVILLIGIVAVTAVSLFANDPTEVPWPMGISLEQMDSTKTLMNSYGDPQNNWSLGIFHCGIDIDSWTETPNCDDVRSVLDGDVVISNMYRFYTDSAYQWIVIPTEGTDSLNHEDNGWLYSHLSNPMMSVT